MPGYLLQVGGIINCFHQSGIVTPTLVNPPRVKVNGTQQILTAPESLKVAGCLFNILGSPHPASWCASRLRHGSRSTAGLRPFLRRRLYVSRQTKRPKGFRTRTRHKNG